MKIRGFIKADIPFALEQTGREGWDSTGALFEALLAHDPEGSFVAEEDGRVAGMVTTTTYRESAWIGNLIVPPEFRGASLGSRLMQHAIRHLEQRGVESIRLEADPMGINIYRRLGFQDEFESPRFRLDHCESSSAVEVAGVLSNDLDEVSELDFSIFGDDRSLMLRLLFENSAAAFKTPPEGAVGGYIFVQGSTQGYRLGPWVARNRERAGYLLDAALEATRPKPVIVALPGVNLDGSKLFLSRGFRQTPSSFRMLRGRNAARGVPERIYGLAGGAIG